MSEIADCELVLWLKPGDELLPEMHMALKLWRCFESNFCLVDMFFSENGRVYPLFLHGVDILHAIHVDYYWSRFAVNGRILREVLATPGDDNAYQISKLSLRQSKLDCNDRQSKFSHVSLPLIRIDQTYNQICLARRRLIHDVSANALNDDLYAMDGDRLNQDTSSLKISVIICTKNSGLLLRQLLARLCDESAVYEVVIVSNNTTDPYALETLLSAQSQKKTSVLRYDQFFNFSRQCNLGVKHSTGDTILLLNDDITPASDDWLEKLSSWLDDMPRRIVAPMLLYPNETVQHAGMFLGYNNVAGHAFRHAKLPDGGHNFLLSAPRRVSSLTGAALLLPRYLYEELNGFDPLLGTYLQDVDLSLRARDSGVELILDPRAMMFHMESVSVRPKLDDTEIQRIRINEFQYFKRRWGEVVNHDIWMNPLIDPSDETFRTLRR